MFCEVSPGEAGEPNQGYWFIETFTSGDVKLPEGVSIHMSDPAVSPRGYLLLENTTKELLFVLSLDYKDVLVMTTPDPNWENRVNSAHEVASYLATSDRAVILKMEALADLDHSLKDQNVSSDELPPANTTIPAGQSSELLLLYDERVIVVPFTVTYSLNPDFGRGSNAYPPPMASPALTLKNSPNVTQQAAGPKSRVESAILIAVLLGTIGLITGWMVWRKAAQSKNRHQE